MEHSKENTNKAVPEIEGDRWNWFYVCSVCHTPINWKQEVCPGCKKEIKWNE